MKFFNVLTALVLFSMTATASQYQLKNCKESAKLNFDDKTDRMKSSVLEIYPLLENGDVLEVSGSVNSLPLSLAIGNKLSVEIKTQADDKTSFSEGVRWHSISRAQLKDNGKKLMIERSEFSEGAIGYLFGARALENATQIEMTETKLKWKKIYHSTWPNGSMTYTCELNKIN